MKKLSFGARQKLNQGEMESDVKIDGVVVGYFYHRRGHGWTPSKELTEVFGDVPNFRHIRDAKVELRGMFKRLTRKPSSAHPDTPTVAPPQPAKDAVSAPAALKTPVMIDAFGLSPMVRSRLRAMAQARVL